MSLADFLKHDARLEWKIATLRTFPQGPEIKKQVERMEHDLRIFRLKLWLKKVDGKPLRFIWPTS